MFFLMFFLSEQSRKLQDCAICGNESLIANTLEICKDCLRKEPEKTSDYISAAHNKARERMNLPQFAPQSVDTNCALCNHMCGIGLNEKSFCGLRYNLRLSFNFDTPGIYTIEWNYRVPHTPDAFWWQGHIISNEIKIEILP